jgi:hypothetical protein
MREDERDDRRGVSKRAVRAREAWQGKRLRSTRTRLRACGIRLIATHGYEKTTAQDIAAAAGVSTMTFFRHFPSKEDVVLGMPPDSDGVAAAEQALGAIAAGTSPLEAARAVLRAAAKALGQEGLSDVALRLVIVRENPPLLRALYARVPLWVQMVGLLLPDSLRGADGFSTRLTAATIVLYWLEVMQEWSRRGGTEADAASLSAVADEAMGLMANLSPVPAPAGGVM